MKTHMHRSGGKTSKTYRSWESMKGRCYNKNDPSYPRYGERGITVCDRWLHSFENFFEDMGERPPSKTLDRINNDGNYEPGNCKWATNKEQQNNMHNNNLINFNGKILSVSVWAVNLSIKRNTLNSRLIRGWSINRALSTKARGYRQQ